MVRAIGRAGGCVLAGALVAAVANAAEVGDQRSILERIDKLEQRNAELEKKFQEQEAAMGEDRISETEPELAARLKAVEAEAMGFRKQARAIESLEGIAAGLGFTMVGQHASDSSTTALEGDEGELNYRADITVSLPGGEIGNAAGSIFAHFRMGQGEGLSNMVPTFASPNAATFQRPDTTASDSTALLAQAWYQLDVPLPLNGYAPQSREHLEFNFGKMDPFVFFDQNSAADDETRFFLNSAFVHNPLLDAGGDIGADDFGFTPGLRLAYVTAHDKPVKYGVSLGVFGAGKGAAFEKSLDSPFAIVQFDTEQRFFGGLPGNYRLYVWNNGRGEDIDGTIRSHSGIGLSADQRVGDSLTLIGRLGHLMRGVDSFDQALTLGAELRGNGWNRAGDAAGLAWGRLAVSDEFRAQSLTVDADGDSVPDYGYQAKGAEQILELYYRWRLNGQLEITPDFQYIHTPGGNDQENNLRIIQLRAQVNY